VMPIWLLKKIFLQEENRLEQDIDVNLLKMYSQLDIGLAKNGKEIYKILSEN